MSKCHIAGNHVSRLKCILRTTVNGMILAVEKYSTSATLLEGKAIFSAKKFKLSVDFPNLKK